MFTSELFISLSNGRGSATGGNGLYDFLKSKYESIPSSLNPSSREVLSSIGELDRLSDLVRTNFEKKEFASPELVLQRKGRERRLRLVTHSNGLATEKFDGLLAGLSRQYGQQQPGMLIVSPSLLSQC